MILQLTLEPDPVDLVSDIAGDVKRLIADLTNKISDTAKASVERRGRVSLPGETPSFQTGNLVAGIETRIADFEGEINFNAPYSGFLELGTSKMQARPFIEKSIDTVLAKAIPTI